MLPLLHFAAAPQPKRPDPDRIEPVTWSPVTESNRRPSPYHGDALPTELTGPGFYLSDLGFLAWRPNLRPLYSGPTASNLANTATTGTPAGEGELTVLLPSSRLHLDAANLSARTVRAYTDDGAARMGQATARSRRGGPLRRRSGDLGCPRRRRGAASGPLASASSVFTGTLWYDGVAHGSNRLRVTTGSGRRPALSNGEHA